MLELLCDNTRGSNTCYMFAVVSNLPLLIQNYSHYNQQNVVSTRWIVQETKLRDAGTWFQSQIVDWEMNREFFSYSWQRIFVELGCEENKVLSSAKTLPNTISSQRLSSFFFSSSTVWPAVPACERQLRWCWVSVWMARLPLLSLETWGV